MADKTSDSRQEELQEKVRKSGIISELRLEEKVTTYTEIVFNQEMGMYFGGEKEESYRLIGGNSAGQRDRINDFLLSRPEFLEAFSELELVEKKENLEKARNENKNRGKAAQQYYTARLKLENISKSLLYAEIEAGNPAFIKPTCPKAR